MKTMLETRPLDSTLFREMVQCFPEGRLWFSVHEVREKKNGVYERMRSHSLTASQQCFHWPLKACFSRLRLLRLTAVVSWRGSCRICAFWYYVPELSAGLCLNRFSPFMMIFFRRVALSSKFSYTCLDFSGRAEDFGRVVVGLSRYSCDSHRQNSSSQMLHLSSSFHPPAVSLISGDLKIEWKMTVRLTTLALQLTVNTHLWFVFQKSLRHLVRIIPFQQNDCRFY